MKNQTLFSIIFGVTCLAFSYACSQANSETEEELVLDATLAAAFSKFDTDNVSIMLDGDEVVIESNGMPNHESPYWNPNNSLYEASDNVNFNPAPGYIQEVTSTLRVDANPQLASSSSATRLGPIGIAVTGAVIYNDQEGPNVPLDDAVVSLDKNGAHTGPVSYHYHLEPISFSYDDTALIGIISDGFFIYGRKCVGDLYPEDLDESGGHTSATIDNDEGEYHYHIQNELYLNAYYILFPGDYQGTGSTVSQ